MENVCNKLGLNKDANEGSILAAIENMSIANKNVKEEYNAMKKCYDESMAENAKMKEALDALNKKMEEEEMANKAKAESEMENKAVALIEDAVNSGRIKNEAELVANFKLQAVANYDLTKKIIDSMPVTKVSNKIPTPDGTIKNATEEVDSMIAKHLSSSRKELKMNI
jgi:hypothetical protein